MENMNESPGKINIETSNDEKSLEFSRDIIFKIIKSLTDIDVNDMIITNINLNINFEPKVNYTTRKNISKNIPKDNKYKIDEDELTGLINFLNNQTEKNDMTEDEFNEFKRIFLTNYNYAYNCRTDHLIYTLEDDDIDHTIINKLLVDVELPYLVENIDGKMRISSTKEEY